MSSFDFTVARLAESLGGTLDGDGAGRLVGVASVEAAGPTDVTFVADARRAGQLADCRAGAAIVGGDCPPAALPLIRVASVPRAVAALLNLLGEPEVLPPAGVHPSAILAADAVIGEGAAIGPRVVVDSGAVIAPGAVLCAGVCVGAGVRVGEGTILFEGTVVQGRATIGQRCRIGPNAVIGSCGFGYYYEGRHNRVPHAGTVEIGDEVDIGACSCVDRAKFGATRIGAGTKIDNLVQIAHNVQIGRGCLLAGFAAVGGSAVLKDGVVLGGRAGIRDHITLGAGVRGAGGAVVLQDVPAGQTVVGAPAREGRLGLRIWQAQERLPELLKRVRALEERLKRLESPADH